MALSKETAQKFIDIVSGDADCRKIIVFEAPGQRTVFGAGVSYLGLAGSTRNLLLLPFPDTLDKNDCNAIARATSLAIGKRKSEVPGLYAVAVCHREVNGWHHSATWFRMQDESEYVFDWHKTLNIFNPWLNTRADWGNATNEISFSNFGGFA